MVYIYIIHFLLYHAKRTATYLILMCVVRVLRSIVYRCLTSVMEHSLLYQGKDEVGANTDLCALHQVLKIR